MAGSVNKVILVGNLGKDPEVRTMNNGGEVVSFSIATSENWNDKASGERKEKTEWHNVVIFNENLGRIAKQYLRKGSSVYVEGQRIGIAALVGFVEIGFQIRGRGCDGASPQRVIEEDIRGPGRIVLRSSLCRDVAVDRTGLILGAAADRQDLLRFEVRTLVSVCKLGFEQGYMEAPRIHK